MPWAEHVWVNLFETHLKELLDGLEILLAEGCQLEHQLQPDQARRQLDEWAAANSPRFQAGYQAALECLSGASHLEAIVQEKPERVNAWSSSAVGGDTQYRLVRDHRHPIGPVVAEQQSARAQGLRAAWDRQMEKLLQVARGLTAPPVPPRALEFQARCREQLSLLAAERLRLSARDYDIRARVVLSDLKKELGQLGLSWELRQSLAKGLE